MQPVGKRHQMESNDDLGDPTATPFKGPAIDNEESVFLMRRLPLAVGVQDQATGHGGASRSQPTRANRNGHRAGADEGREVQLL